MRIDLSKIVLRLKTPSKKTRVIIEPKEVPPKKLTKLVNGLVKLEDGIYTCVISYTEFAERMFGDIKVEEITTTIKSINIPFTVESFDCKLYKTIFLRAKTKYGYLAQVRTESQCIFGNYPNSLYIPFAPNWIVRGWIVKIDNKLQFKFRNLVTVEGHDYRYKGLLDDDEFKWFKANKDGKK